MPFVQRDQDDRIVGIFAVEQPGLAEEWVESAEIPVAVIIPERVSAFQAREALAQTPATAPGYESLLAQVEDVVAQADDTTKRAWAFATEFRRNSPTIAVLAQAMSLTDGQLDDLFILAAQIAA